MGPLYNRIYDDLDIYKRTSGEAERAPPMGLFRFLFLHLADADCQKSTALVGMLDERHDQCGKGFGVQQFPTLGTPRRLSGSDTARDALLISATISVPLPPCGFDRESVHNDVH